MVNFTNLTIIKVLKLKNLSELLPLLPENKRMDWEVEKFLIPSAGTALWLLASGISTPWSWAIHTPRMKAQFTYGKGTRTRLCPSNCRGMSGNGYRGFDTMKFQMVGICLFMTLQFVRPYWSLFYLVKILYCIGQN